MDNPPPLTAEQFDRILKEYEICDRQATRLEGLIWQTATLFGVGSGAGLVYLALQDPSKQATAVTVMIAAIFATNASLAWWRFARRWWSIQGLMFNRMAKLGQKIGFHHATIVRQRDEDKMARIGFLQKNGRWYQRIRWNCFYSIRYTRKPAKEGLRHNDNYEHRGNQPVTKLLLVTLILLWWSLAAYAACKAGLVPQEPIAIAILLSAAIVYLGLIVFFWRMR